MSKRKNKGQEDRKSKIPRTNQRISIDKDDHIADCVVYIEDFVDDPVQVFELLKQEIDFEQGMVKVYGKEWNERRLTSLHGDNPSDSYEYAGKKRNMKSMTPTLKMLRDKLHTDFGVYYDFVLLNLYRNGEDKIGLHSDNEKGMDKTDIASISLGSERIFRLKRKSDGKWAWEKRLANGSLVRMQGQCQDLYKHEVPEEKGLSGERINLTFRRIVKK